MRRPYDGVKRGMDLVIACAALVVSAPLQAGVAALVRFNLGSPVLFRQERPGLNGKTFTMYKFRTMRDFGPGCVTDEERITAFGSWLRSTSLDELPELYNVARGDMSLVGPRPLLPEYLPLYTARQSRRHEVRPGITGLAQVKGRNSIPWAERLAWDVRYVETRGFLLDSRIILDTIAVLFQREGITEEGQVAMTDFMGAPDVDL
ncbi:sugar transferase [Tessaracoccus sp. MC1679]|uniref:sugar transferase n=1 Tax=Tessaracoccus sp. MC1679 TaxID=2760313 RepID=UPI00351C5474